MVMRIALLFIAVFLQSAFAFKQFRGIARLNIGLKGVKVMIEGDEPIENTLRKFKRGVSQSGHLMEARFREFFENNHDKKKRRAERARMLNKIERTNDRYERRAEGVSEYNS